MEHKKKLYFLFSAGGMLALILDGQTALLGAAEGLELCIRVVIPSLFPFLFLSTLLTGALWGNGSKFLVPAGRLMGIPAGAESLLIAGFLGPFIPSAALLNLIEGIVQVALFLGYLILCSRQKDIKRVFAYHGAEHKTIFCYEAGLELTVDNVRSQPKHHPRCGTSFLFVVIVVSILFSSVVFTFVDGHNALIRVLVHLLLLIPVVSVTYEFNRFVGRHDNAVTRFLSAPGMWLQNFTTNEPDDSMIEVAIEAMKLVLPDEQGKDAW